MKYPDIAALFCLVGTEDLERDLKRYLQVRRGQRKPREKKLVTLGGACRVAIASY